MFGNGLWYISKWVGRYLYLTSTGSVNNMFIQSQLLLSAGAMDVVCALG